LATCTGTTSRAVSDGTASLAYLSEGVDLVHDAQHSAAELPGLAYLGHSAIDYAIGLAERAGAGRVTLFHHDPTRSDAELDVIVERRVQVEAAAEGMVIDLPGETTSRSGGAAEAGAGRLGPPGERRRW
jgi:hypothetical protein